jgi:hypothetical protein
VQVLERRDALAIPSFDFVKAPLVGFNRENHRHRFRVVSKPAPAVAVKETISQNGSGSFVAADPWMVFDKPETELPLGE